MMAQARTFSPSAPDPFCEDLMALRPALRGMAMRYTHNASLAEDLVHDTVLRALRFRASFVPGSHLRAWVATIMAHTFINGYRRRRREREILEGASREDVAGYLRSDAARAAAAGPEADLTHNMLSDTVLQALARVPEEFRQVVMLCDVLELSYKEAARALSCPLGTIMSRLHRARRLLKVELGPEARIQGITKAA
jgi:RNA polymerase sigma-70 factor (ECF subfamily)